jgi:hypothetical protein
MWCLLHHFTARQLFLGPFDDMVFLERKESVMVAERPMHGWRGETRQTHWFAVFGINETLDFDGIVYILARARPDRLFDPLYVGQSGQGGVRLANHEKMASARYLGATHVHIHFVEDASSRFSIETDLRRLHRPPLNEQSTPAPVGALSALGDIFGFGGLPPSGFSPGGGILAALAHAAPPAPATLPYSLPFERSPLADLFEPGNSLAALSRALSKTR